MHYDFDRIIDRSGTGSFKWDCYDKDVLPLWVADMDFESPPEVIQALVERARHGVFGYTREPAELSEVICQRMLDYYGWRIEPDWIVYLGGVVAGFNVAAHTLAGPGGLLVFTPVYPPMLEAAGNAGLKMKTVQLVQGEDNRYECDWPAVEAALASGVSTLLLCSPHNPVGRVFTRLELERLARLCLDNKVAIISDEIHCDLIYPGHPHIPTASLSREISLRTITLMAPSKTFNVPGLGCSFAIVEDEGLRRRLHNADRGMLPHVNLMGYTAALAAYRYGGDWLNEVRAYLFANYQAMRVFLAREMPEIQAPPVEGTYLAWLDCRALHLPGGPYRYFLDKARVALNDGSTFGPGGEGFVRLNFACPRAVLLEALERMCESLR